MKVERKSKSKRVRRKKYQMTDITCQKKKKTAFSGQWAGKTVESSKWKVERISTVESSKWKVESKSKRVRRKYIR
ncbi:MAG TPA: hypothetical protein VJ990_08665 [Clostridia bacterium]|nr:hypothetical protein [Clostridia bacterium]